MPVLDHEVHQKTRQDSSARYGCHNKPRRRDPVLVKNGFLHFGAGSQLGYQKFSLRESYGSLECRYDHSLTDGKCEGCQHRGSGEDYDRRIRTQAEAGVGLVMTAKEPAC